MPPQPRRSRTTALLRHWLPIGSGVVATSLLAIAGISPHAHFDLGHHSYAWSSHLLILGIVFAIFAAFSSGRRQRRLDRLEARSAKAERSAHAGRRAVLRLIFQELDALRSSAHHYSNERVSLFRWEGDHFILLGRRSLGPYQESPGRDEYLRCQDCLSKAWLAGRAEDLDLPPPGAGVPWNEDWIAAQGARGIPRVVAQAMAMPSRCYFAFRINTDERPLGVLVFESINSPHEATQTGSNTILDLERLDRLQRRSSQRLANLLRESSFVSAEEIKLLLRDVPD